MKEKITITSIDPDGVINFQKAKLAINFSLHLPTSSELKFLWKSIQSAQAQKLPRKIKPAYKA